MFKSLIMFFRKLPIARYIKPLWKGALKSLVQKQGDLLQQRLHIMIERDGPIAINRTVDLWQREVCGGITMLPLPEGIEIGLCVLIQKKGDELQEKIEAALRVGGLPAVDKIFDIVQESILVKIEGL